jgi:uncharacterized protein YlxW (UPF0749 family)
MSHEEIDWQAEFVKASLLITRLATDLGAEQERNLDSLIDGASLKADLLEARREIDALRVAHIEAESRCDALTLELEAVRTSWREDRDRRGINDALKAEAARLKEETERLQRELHEAHQTIARQNGAARHPHNAEMEV